MRNAITSIVIICVAVFAAGASAQTSGPDLLQRGQDDYRAGRYAAAADELKAAADAFLSPEAKRTYVETGHLATLPQLETSLVYLAMTYSKLGREADARDAVTRLLAAERVEPTYAALSLPADVADFEIVAGQLVTTPLPTNAALAQARTAAGAQTAEAAPPPPPAPPPAPAPPPTPAPVAETQVAEATPPPSETPAPAPAAPAPPPPPVETAQAPPAPPPGVVVQPTIAEQRAAILREIEARVAEARTQIERDAQQKIAAEREAAQRQAREQVAAAQTQAQRDAEQKIAAEREVAQRQAQEQVAAVQTQAAQAQRDAEQKMTAEREASQRQAQEQVAAAQREAEQKIAQEREASQRAAAQQVEQARAEAQRQAEAQIAAAKETARREEEQRVAEARQAAEREAAQRTAAAEAEARSKFLTMLRSADTLAMNGRLDDANNFYSQVASAPNAPREVIAEAATGLYRTGAFRQAVDAFQRLGNFAKGEEDLRYYDAVSLYEIGKYDEAKKQLACAWPFLQVTDAVSRYRAKIELTPQRTASK